MILIPLNRVSTFLPTESIVIPYTQKKGLIIFFRNPGLTPKQVCYVCGEEGHWKAVCLEEGQRQQTSQPNCSSWCSKPFNQCFCGTSNRSKSDGDKNPGSTAGL